MDGCFAERYETWSRLGPYALLRPREVTVDGQP
jgi:hypothetical protein